MQSQVKLKSLKYCTKKFQSDKPKEKYLSMKKLRVLHIFVDGQYFDKQMLLVTRHWKKNLTHKLKVLGTVSRVHRNYNCRSDNFCLKINTMT